SANTGSLFLDEIGNIHLPQQAKLLTVLQNRQVTRLGTNNPIPVDIRLISATNLDFTELADEKRFRKDLVYRINTVEINIPPLRKRGNDIILLAKHFAKIYAQKYMKPPLILEESAIEKLLAYHFPGNVRELQYTIERAIIMKENNRLSAEDLIFSLIEKGQQQKETDNETELSTIEKLTILRVIEKNKGNITKAAKELGITRTALYRRLNKYDI
ncbi:MAG: sigma 54-interacting transcriptional regulator, partial [Bacteroidota bacterium]